MLPNRLHGNWAMSLSTREYLRASNGDANARKRRKHTAKGNSLNLWITATAALIVCRFWNIAIVAGALI
jgi:hypothetical protein